MAAIRLLKDLESQGRLAAPEEQKVLARYVGWGGLPQAFDEANEKWAAEYAELNELLTPEEYASARGYTPVSYTPLAALPDRTAGRGAVRQCIFYPGLCTE